MRIVGLLLFLGLSASVFAQYTVGTFTKTYTDPARGNRSIPTEVFYPMSGGAPATGSFPVIVFGHGFAMGYDAYQNLWEYWVPRGYIMAFPKTEGSLFPAPSHSAFGADLAFLVGAIQAENSNASSALNGRVANATALMGHSMGGGSSFLGASGNASIRTVVGLAPAETNPSAITAAAQVSVPVMVLSGERDGVTPPANHHLPMYNGVPGSVARKAYVSILGGAHCYFANSNFACDFGESTSSTGISITRAQQHQTTFDYVTPWLDYHLKGDCAAYERLLDSLNGSSTRVAVQHTCQPNPMPDISAQDSLLQTTTPAAAYQWLLNGSPISGATGNQYTAQQTGTYSVQVTFADGCSLTSDTVYVEISQLPSSAPALLPDDMDRALVYGQGAVLHWQGLPSGARIELFDLNGRLLEVFAADQSQGARALEHLPRGLYAVRLSASARSRAWKIVLH